MLIPFSMMNPQSSGTKLNGHFITNVCNLSFCHRWSYIFNNTVDEITKRFYLDRLGTLF